MDHPCAQPLHAVIENTKCNYMFVAQDVYSLHKSRNLCPGFLQLNLFLIALPLLLVSCCHHHYVPEGSLHVCVCVCVFCVTLRTIKAYYLRRCGLLIVHVNRYDRDSTNVQEVMLSFFIVVSLFVCLCRDASSACNDQSSQEVLTLSWLIIGWNIETIKFEAMTN